MTGSLEAGKGEHKTYFARYQCLRGDERGELREEVLGEERTNVVNLAIKPPAREGYVRRPQIR
jgi:hypothetical protein